MISACGLNTAKVAVEDYLKKYKTLDSEVLVDLEEVVEKENLDEEEKQYKDLSYEVIDEEYDGDIAYITVKISVYDLYKAQSNASDYLANNKEEFTDEFGNYDASKYTNFKLDKMKDTTDKIEYTLTFTVNKENDKYIVDQPTENDLMKIHGIYNYEND